MFIVRANNDMLLKWLIKCKYLVNYVTCYFDDAGGYSVTAVNDDCIDCIVVSTAADLFAKWHSRESVRVSNGTLIFVIFVCVQIVCLAP